MKNDKACVPRRVGVLALRTASIAKTSVAVPRARWNMEIDGRDFLNTPPMKTVRFGGRVAETLAKHKKVSGDVMSEPHWMISDHFNCCYCHLKGDSSDYELLKHQLADPDIKVEWSLKSLISNEICFVGNIKYNKMMWVAVVLLSELSGVTGCSDHQLASRISELCDSTN